MATLELPTNKALPAYKYVITLEGLAYEFKYQFNERMGKWFVSIGDPIGNPLIAPVPIVASWPLFDRFKNALLPPGTVYAFDTSGALQDPGRFDLGDRVRMVYKESG